jgi:hypothetical protein
VTLSIFHTDLTESDDRSALEQRFLRDLDSVVSRLYLVLFVVGWTQIVNAEAGLGVSEAYGLSLFGAYCVLGYLFFCAGFDGVLDGMAPPGERLLCSVGALLVLPLPRYRGAREPLWRLAASRRVDGRTILPPVDPEGAVSNW